MNAITTFDYGNLTNSELASVIRDRHRLGEKSTIEALSVAQSRLAGRGRDGRFMPWLHGQCGISRRTAYHLLKKREKPPLAGIYFIQAEVGVCPIKIGFTTNLWHRFKQLQTGSAFALTLIYFLRDGTDVQEKELHLRFLHHRMRAEWFFPSAELDGVIDKLRKESPWKTHR